MRWVRPVTAELDGPREELGGKALGLALLHRLGLRVPPAFVVTADACRAFLDTGRLPDGLREELALGIAGLEHATGRAFGGPGRPLAVSVRSGAGVSMPGMMDTVLGLGLTRAATAALAAETGDEAFARDCRERFLRSFARAGAGSPEAGAPEAGALEARGLEARGLEAGLPQARSPEAGAPEAETPEAEAPEARALKTGQLQARAPEAETPEAETPEARALKTGPLQARAPEAGAPGAVPVQAHPLQTRPLQAGPLETGPLETGPLQARAPEVRPLQDGAPEAGLLGAARRHAVPLRPEPPAEPASSADHSPAAATPPSGAPVVPDHAPDQLALALAAVFGSWRSPRAHTYRTIHAIPHGLGTAVVVQAMVFGNRDARSGTGVAFSRDPTTGEDTPYGEVLFHAQGEDVVSGARATRPLAELAVREPALWAELTGALRRIEGCYRDVCYTEFTYESGELWLLQVRPGRFENAAAVRTAVELAEAGVIRREEALLRVAPGHLAHVRTPRIAGPARIVARGLGACPGVAVGRVAVSAEAAVRMARDSPVVLVRPETSPHDMRGIAAAVGIVTERGGPASHAAVVARALGRPAVVGAAGLDLAEGTLVTVDGTSGEVALGTPRIVTDTADAPLHTLLTWADDVSGDRTERAEADRLAAAHHVLGAR
ncbi:pyruvate, phosphate dikinase [Streptomyces roseirectus]|uniref:Pyruvate, phosphate dikinase n=1 Tax=Streptomyces roseirectus TaxID=2768066 RepID=A0A7H0INW5_9ACTN|nr:PEP/pyruvate-binding domain-containing protein [Streptomyces roseirectus]QNP74481.1 pyruvate, phosphate dikinase [Streptomyces roseirectus]